MSTLREETFVAEFQFFRGGGCHVAHDTVVYRGDDELTRTRHRVAYSGEQAISPDVVRDIDATVLQQLGAAQAKVLTQEQAINQLEQDLQHHTAAAAAAVEQSAQYAAQISAMESQLHAAQQEVARLQAELDVATRVLAGAVAGQGGAA